MAPKDRYTLGVLVVVIAVGFVGAGYLWSESRPIPFDQARWRAVVVGSADDTRSRMAAWLVERGDLVGKSKGDVVALLGPVTDADKFREYGLVYWIGRSGIDSEWLVLTLEPSGIVTKAQITTD